MLRRAVVSSTLAAALALSCGGRVVSSDPSGIDASAPDDGGIDAGPSYRCGDLTCRGNEVCITHPVQPGPAIRECVPYPAGCERDFTCICVEYHLPAACSGPAQGCSDDRSQVTLFCD